MRYFLGGPAPPRQAGEPAAEEPADIVEWVRERLEFEADATQAAVLRSGAKRGILNCTRQWGKSTLTAAKAVYEAWSRPDSLILAFSAGERQSGEHLRKAEEFARRLGLRVRGDGKNRKSMAFPNGSRMVALPEAPPKIRGFSAPSLVLIDEAAQVSDELYHAVRPMLAVSDGAVWMMSTPFGKRGFFWETWERGGAEWERVRATAYDCPRISRAFLEEERKVLGARKFGQEYLSEFSDVEGAVFDREWIEALRTDIEPFQVETATRRPVPEPLPGIPRPWLQHRMEAANLSAFELTRSRGGRYASRHPRLSRR